MSALGNASSKIIKSPIKWFPFAINRTGVPATHTCIRARAHLLRQALRPELHFHRLVEQHRQHVRRTDNRNRSMFRMCLLAVQPILFFLFYMSIGAAFQEYDLRLLPILWLGVAFGLKLLSMSFAVSLWLLGRQRHSVELKGASSGGATTNTTDSGLSDSHGDKTAKVSILSINSLPSNMH